MSQVFVGNIIIFVASVAMLASGLMRTKRAMLLVQMLECILMAVGNICLLSIPGAISNLLSVGRNVLCYKNKMSATAKIVLILMATIMSVANNNLGIIGFLPLISSILFIIYLNAGDETNFQVLMITSLLLWSVHDWYIGSYVALSFDVITIVANVGAIVRAKIRSGGRIEDSMSSDTNRHMAAA